MNMDYHERRIEFYKEQRAIKQRARFSFDAKKHLYKLDGKVIPSVTDIIGIAWENRFKYVKPDILELARRRGIMLHKLFRYIAAGKKPVEWLEKHTEYKAVADSLEEFINDYQFKMLQSEFSAWARVNTVTYGFTVDNISYSKHFRKSLVIDYKTGQKNEDYENVQTAAYLGSFFVYHRERKPDKSDIKTIDEHWARAIYYSKTNKFRFIDKLGKDWSQWMLILNSFKYKEKEV